LPAINQVNMQTILAEVILFAASSFYQGYHIFN
jgi:hypothetical protein